MSLFEKLRFGKSGKDGGVDAKIAADLALMKASAIPRDGIETTLAEIQRRQRLGTQEEFSVPRERMVFSRAVQRTFQSVVGTAGALVMLCGGWLYFADQTPDIKPVTQRLPTPNGYDTLIQATKLLPSAKECDEWIKDWERGNEGNGQKLRKNNDEEVFFNHCMPAVDLLRFITAILGTERVAKQEFQIPQVDRLDILMPQLGEFNKLAKIIYWKSKYEQSQGNYAAAMKDCGLLMKFAALMDRGGSLPCYYLRMTIETLALTQMQRLYPFVAPEIAEQSEDIFKEARPASNDEFSIARTALDNDKASTILALTNLFAKPNWREEFQRLLRTQFGTYIDPGTQQNDFATKLALYTVNKKWAVKNYTHYMDTAIARADKRESWKLEDPAMPFDLVVRWVTPSVKPAFFAQARLLTLRHLVRCAYNLQIYSSRNGHYPDQLKHLTSDPAIWADPFADNSKEWQPLRYKRVGKGYLLYSVGPDGKDDGGKPLVNPNTHQPLKDPAQMTETSVGDVVFRNR